MGPPFLESFNVNKIYCSYCGKEAKLVNGNEIYHNREDLFDRFFYFCQDCNAYVGCHKITKNPLGTLANKELRDKRKFLHKTFDRIWQEGKISRTEAYNKLAKFLKISKSKCHIGKFGIRQCDYVLNLLKDGKFYE